MHRWASQTVTRYHDPVFDDHIRAHPEPEKQSGRDKTFLPKVEPRGGNPLVETLEAAFCMVGWAAILWIIVSLFAFFMHGRWYLPPAADLGY